MQLVESDALNHARKLRSLAPDTNTLKHRADAYLMRLHDKRQDDDQMRRERDARRRRVAREQSESQDASAKRAALEELVDLLAKQSAEEQVVSERLWRVRQEEAVLMENRALREAQYAARRDADWTAAVGRQVAAFQDLKNKAARERAALSEEARRALDQAEALDKKRGREGVRRLTEELFDLAIKMAEYRANTDTEVPKREMAEWKNMWVAGDGAALRGEDPEADRQEAREKELVQQYLDYAGEWTRPTEEKAAADAGGGGSSAADEHGGETPLTPETEEEKKKALGDLLWEAMVTAKGETRPELRGNPRDLPVKLSVVGAPFAGKSTVVRAVADAQELLVIEPEGLVARACEAARAAGPAEESEGEEE